MKEGIGLSLSKSMEILNLKYCVMICCLISSQITIPGRLVLVNFQSSPSKMGGKAKLNSRNRWAIYVLSKDKGSMMKWKRWSWGWRMRQMLFCLRNRICKEDFRPTFSFGLLWSSWRVIRRCYWKQIVIYKSFEWFLFSFDVTVNFSNGVGCWSN